MPPADQAPRHGAIVDPSELAAVPGSMLDAAKAYAADVLSLPAEPAPRTLPVTPAERACATVLRAWLEWNRAPGPIEESPEDEALCSVGAALYDDRLIDNNGDATPAGAALLARVEAEERMPAAVLFAMARAYGDAEAAARVVDYSRPSRRAAQFHADRDELVCELARVENQGCGPLLLGNLAADYAARLAGATPIDAPPAKEPR